jgi:hypothetical protein
MPTLHPVQALLLVAYSYQKQELFTHLLQAVPALPDHAVAADPNDSSSGPVAQLAHLAAVLQAVRDLQPTPGERWQRFTATMQRVHAEIAGRPTHTSRRHASAAAAGRRAAEAQC